LFQRFVAEVTDAAIDVVSKVCVEIVATCEGNRGQVVRMARTPYKVGRRFSALLGHESLRQDTSQT